MIYSVALYGKRLKDVSWYAPLEMASMNKLTRLPGVISRSSWISPHSAISAPFRFLSTSATLLGPKKPAAAPAPVAKATTKLERKIHPVETDPEKLAKFCCINYMADKTEGGPGPELREDEYYPDWLWECNKTLTPWYELDPKTNQYWKQQQQAYTKHRARIRRAQTWGPTNQSQD